MGCDGEKATSERVGDRTEAPGECAPFWSAWGYRASGRPGISTVKSVEKPWIISEKSHCRGPKSEGTWGHRDDKTSETFGWELEVGEGRS